jgi:hypothetical protein
MGCGGSKITTPCVFAALTVFKTNIDLTKYNKSIENRKTMQQAMASPIFGGSVLLPVGELKKKRTKSNPIYDELCNFDKMDKDKKIPLDILKNGGFYVFKNIRISENSNEFVDAWILAKSMDNKVYKKISEHNLVDQKTGLMNPIRKMSLKGVTEKPKSVLDWETVKQACDGYARLIYFKNHSQLFKEIEDREEVFGDKVYITNDESTNLEITKIEEGSFKLGNKQGYVRVMIP